MKSKTVSRLTIARPILRQRGASLLEGIAYLGIAAIVVLGAVSLLTGAFGSARSNQMTEEVVAIRTAARKMYMGQSYPAAMLPTLISAQAMPATLAPGATPATTRVNAWGGAVTVTGAGGTFSISYANVPQDVCISTVSGANGWKGITSSTGGTAVPSFPATAAAATALCNNATANTVVFTAS